MQGAILRCLIGLFLLINVCAFFHPFVPNSLAEQREKNIFTTWEVFEVDKCASIWLITRFIDQDAEIKIIPKGEFPAEGIPFDMPDAKFRRYFNMSTYESLLKHYKLTDPKLEKIGKIIHDVEINTWERKKYPESRQALEAINKIIMTTKNSDEIMEKSGSYFDLFYEKIKP